MSMQELEKAVRKSRKDRFELGTVVRWISSGTYRYAAIKTEIGWVTTARFTPSRYSTTGVGNVLTFNDLLAVLARNDTSDVAVADTWSNITGLDDE